MVSKPEPVNARDAKAAEARLNHLHARFQAASNSITTQRRSTQVGNWSLSMPELALMIGGLAFLGWGSGHLLGFW